MDLQGAVLFEVADIQGYMILGRPIALKMGYINLQESSYLTTFDTPWGKYRWLCMPFGLKISGDVFQEHLDKVLQNTKATEITNITTVGAIEVYHDISMIRLLETAQINSIKFNNKKFIFRTTDHPYFSGCLMDTCRAYNVLTTDGSALTRNK